MRVGPEKRNFNLLGLTLIHKFGGDSAQLDIWTDLVTDLHNS